jgi:hypothetical protein
MSIFGIVLTEINRNEYLVFDFDKIIKIRSNDILAENQLINYKNYLLDGMHNMKNFELEKYGLVDLNRYINVIINSGDFENVQYGYQKKDTKKI